MPLPKALKEEPELTLGLHLFYEGFLNLTSCRQMGMGMGPIPYLTMLDYCDRFGITGQQRERFCWLIQRLDEKYLKYVAEKTTSKA